MNTYIAMLRGINVSGQKKINMQDLKALLGSIDLHQVRTYIQSGNVVFQSSSTEPADIASRIGTSIAGQYGFEVPVVVRTVSDIAGTLSGNPFLTRPDVEADKLHVTFLSESPAPALLDKIRDIDFQPDAFVTIGREIFVYCPDGYGRTKITNTYFENKLKVTATTRNWRTVLELYNMSTQAV
jgi:uncharacterized protein (DUF1697 family)